MDSSIDPSIDPSITKGIVFRFPSENLSPPVSPYHHHNQRSKAKGGHLVFVNAADAGKSVSHTIAAEMIADDEEIVPTVQLDNR